ncbi:hypothetical protein ASPWEDRAFT_42534 [Aspergillus wentii DTO 134E9]|uniref:Hcy-binding domain-containing protein n=1 Tax=Aspergillus wentii DTO 134E9 TaxID=1073089 RepID=A0A1L9RI45_ASPWE|nr:uncharacterized protein ASPWEDRAFT_42534 [Aspergillus wentii DTO 134E9]KAI9925866.1 hypothetical protein MW887_005672 [Aspergillus wentii]OJJ34538.1 hypothetical protein ASPWEDRAFT_42534 [Aspergillus wentii DTO 134E9]
MPPILILDGGLGTTLQLAPHNITFTPETPLWSSHLLLSSPSTLNAVHRAFVSSGADILLTATYQTSFEGFTRTDEKLTHADAGRYMRSAVSLARVAFGSDRPARVALSLGPYGATMVPVSAEYSGLYPAGMNGEGPLREWHTARLGVFAEDKATWEGLEYIAFETVKRADEVRAIRGTMQEVLSIASRKPWWICGVFPDEEVKEEDIREWVQAAVGGDVSPRPWGIGVNCSKISNLGRIVDIMQDEVTRLSAAGQFVDEWSATSGRPWLVLYPDGTRGERYDPVSKEWVKTGDDTQTKPWEHVFCDVVKDIKEGEWEGVIMGGCCRTGPKEIAALKQQVEESITV